MHNTIVNIYIVNTVIVLFKVNVNIVMDLTFNVVFILGISFTDNMATPMVYCKSQ